MSTQRTRFEDDATAIASIEPGIAVTLPGRWTAHRRLQRYQSVPEAEICLHHLEWKIALPYDPGNLRSRDYRVRLDAHRRVIIIVHGNSDAGECLLNWMLQRANLLHVEDLQRHPLMRRCMPSSAAPLPIRGAELSREESSVLIRLPDL